jgi:hypothetical protein
VGLSVGHERIDATIDELFRHASLESSVFALVSGVYGSGKSHLLMHLTARSLAERRPVFRLSLEYLDADLGHPQRHLTGCSTRRCSRCPAARARSTAWSRGPAPRALDGLRALLGSHRRAPPATPPRPRRKALARDAPQQAARRRRGELPLGLGPRAGPPRRPTAGTPTSACSSGSSSSRADGCRGPMILIDEAENLFRAFTAPQRRAALRSLSYYCGGTLPGSCVVLAITPDALDRLRGEADAQLADVAEQRTVLPSEDAAMLRRRLHQVRPIEVPDARRGAAGGAGLQGAGAARAGAGSDDDPRWASWVTETIATPRRRGSWCAGRSTGWRASGGARARRPRVTSS